jgi:hypothetical protein
VNLGLSGLLVSWETLCTFHPAFALAVLNGIGIRPSTRMVQAKFSSAALGTQVPASFDAIITTYSVFGGVDITIDPTNAFPGNPIKAQSDFFQTWGASGITLTLQARTKGDNDYNPLPSDTPLQMVPAMLNKVAGAWHMINPDNIKAQVTLASVPPGGVTAVPFTVWLGFTFLTLGPGGENYLSIPAARARTMLAAQIAALESVPPASGSSSGTGP